MTCSGEVESLSAQRWSGTGSPAPQLGSKLAWLARADEPGAIRLVTSSSMSLGSVTKTSKTTSRGERSGLNAQSPSGRSSVRPTVLCMIGVPTVRGIGSLQSSPGPSSVAGST